MFICMQSFGKMALLIWYFFYLRYNLDARTIYDKLNISAHYVLAI